MLGVKSPGWSGVVLVGWALAASMAPTSASASPGEAAGRLRARSAGGVSIRVDPGRGIVRFAGTPGGVSGLHAAGRPESAASAFLAEFGGLFRLGHPGVSTRLHAVTTDALGHTRVDFAQQYRGLDVFGTSVRVHFDPAGELIFAQAAFVPVVDVSVVPSFGAAEAESFALGHVNGASWVRSTELMIFDLGLVTKSLSDPRLAYAVEVAGPGVHETTWIDAHDGAVILSVSHIHDVLDRAIYDSGYGAAFLTWQEADGAYAGGDPQVEGLIDFTEDTYQLFDNLSSGAYPSYDGASATMEAVVNAPLECPNANWDGVSTNFCYGLATDDVAGHEWAHAYTMQTHALIYAFQPGALNESFSDIFGESVDLLNGAGLDSPGEPRADYACADGGGSVRWLIGEETEGFGGAIRDMWTPTCMNAPGRMGDGEYVCLPPDAFFDNGGVHTNSGVSNHAFALLVDGGTYNGEVVPAIGMTKALAIYWRAMTTYQGVVSGFADHADALEASCADLMNAGTDLPSPSDGTPSGEIVAPADCVAVAAAITATELHDDPGCGTGSLFDTGAAPEACGATEDPAVLFEETFDAGLAAWTASNAGVAASYAPRDWVLEATPPAGHPSAAVFANGDIHLGDCDDDDQSGVMHLDSPAIDIADTEGAVVLTFSHWLASEPVHDGGNLKISVDGSAFTLVPQSAFTWNGYNTSLDDSSNPLAGQPAFSGSDPGVPTGTWVQSQVDLGGLVAGGQTVRLRFDFGVDGCNGLFGWYVDDVQLLSCAAAAGDTGTGDGTGTGGGGDTTSADTGAGTSEGSTDASSPATSGGDATGGAGPGSGPGPTTGDDDTDTDGPAMTGGDGCGCTTAPPAPAWPWLLLLPATRRRRRCAQQRM